MSADFEKIIRERKTFNGKPFSHWQALADEMVIEEIVRAAVPHLDTKHASIIGYIASRRLMEIAEAENPTMLKRVLRKRSRIMSGFQRIMADLFA